MWYLFYKYSLWSFKLIDEDPDNHDCLEMAKKIVACADSYHNSRVSHENSSRVAGEILFNEFYTKQKNLKK